MDREPLQCGTSNRELQRVSETKPTHHIGTYFFKIYLNIVSVLSIQLAIWKVLGEGTHSGLRWAGDTAHTGIKELS